MKNRQLILILLFFCFGNICGQEKINSEWVKIDSLNYRTILNVLSDSSLVKNKSNFFKKNIPFDTRETKDLGFGLTLIQGGQYGGYTTAWLSVLVYEGDIVQFEIRYDNDDQKIIKRFFKNDKSLSTKIKSINLGGPYLFTYENTLKMEKFKKGVTEVLGQPVDINQANDSDFAKYFDYLTNPLLNYEYGTRCYSGGTEPRGRHAINYFISSKDTLTIREIIKRYNPEGRLYAVDGLLKLSKDKVLTLTQEDKKLIKFILSSNILIRSCNGCIISNNEAVNLINRNNDFSEEIEVIKKENEIRKEQGQPKRNGY